MRDTPVGMPKRRIQIVEEVTLPSVSDKRVLIGEKVREAGLDPEVFLAVVPTDVGEGGRINSNGRLYPTGDVIREHERVSREASDRAIPGYLGHPETQESWDLVMRLLDGRHRIEGDGAVTTEATFGILNNTLGRDLMVAWKAGFNPETSLRGFGVLEVHTLTEDSEFAGMNPGRIGTEFGVVREFELEGYDAVRVASAGTKFPSIADVEVREAIGRICEASGQKFDNEETHMLVKDLKTLAELKEHAPTVYAALVAQAGEAASAVTESKVAEANEASAAKLEEAEQKVRDLELQRDASNETLEALSAKVDGLVADATKRDLRSEVTEAVTKEAKGRPGGALLLTQVMQDFDAGRVGSVEEAKTELTRKASLIEAVAGQLPTPNLENGDDPATPGGDGGVDPVEESAPETAAAGVEELMG